MSKNYIFKKIVENSDNPWNWDYLSQNHFNGELENFEKEESAVIRSKILAES